MLKDDGHLFVDELGAFDKVADAIKLLRDHEPEDGYYLAFSGGKDSLVIKQLAILAGVKFQPVYNVTTVDPPELIRFLREHHPDVTWTRPKYTMWQLILMKGMPPHRTARYCCMYLKEGNAGGRVLVTGVRWEESAARSNRGEIETKWKSHMAKAQKPLKVVNPIIKWTKKEVWEFIKGEGLPYCSLYDEGFQRLGCVLCPMASDEHRQREEKRWPKFAAIYRKMFDKVYEKRAAELKLDEVWSSGEAIYEWYMGRLKVDKKAQYLIDMFIMENDLDLMDGEGLI